MAEYIEEQDGEEVQNETLKAPAANEAPVLPAEGEFVEIFISDEDKKILIDNDVELNQLLRQVGGIQMDYMLTMENLKTRVTETKNKMDGMVNQIIRIKLGSQPFADVSCDFNTNILRVRKV